MNDIKKFTNKQVNYIKTAFKRCCHGDKMHCNLCVHLKLIQKNNNYILI